MSAAAPMFEPVPPLVAGRSHEECRACVTIPARNEAASLERCLDALAAQVRLDGSPLPTQAFEILLLLNNCDDGSDDVARRWKKAHPAVQLEIVEATLPREQAHVGTARRWLMDTAWSRLRGAKGDQAVILTTDADTVVAPDWVERNLLAIAAGADVAGGWVRVLPEDLGSLPDKVRRSYEQDRRYALAIAHLEDLLDPSSGDRWPRHLDHFGSSLACTCEAYEAAGGMPAVSPLEDEAFVDRVRRANLVLRHDPEVQVLTSARLEGRAVVGLAGQFRLWSELPDAGSHTVQSAAYLEHRFRSMRMLREIFASKDPSCLRLTTEWWRRTFREALEEETSCAGFLGAVYCDVLIKERFHGVCEEPIAQAIAGLRGRIDRLQRIAPAPEQREAEDVKGPQVQAWEESSELVQ